MSRDLGPPKKVPRPGLSARAEDTSTYITTNPHHEAGSIFDHTRGGRRGGRYATGFADGFDAGAASALRLMGRRCHCLDCAAVVEELIEYFSGAADRRAS